RMALPQISVRNREVEAGMWKVVKAVRGSKYARFWVFTALAVVLIACAKQTPPEGPMATDLKIVEARATSQTSVIVEFSAPVQTDALRPEAFVIVGPDETNLTVMAALPIGGGSRVALSTVPQQLVQYSLVVNGVGSVDVATTNVAQLQSGFAGSGLAGPVVAHAVGLTSRTILVVFVDPASGAPVAMSDEALARANYTVLPEGIDVLGAAFAPGSADRSQIILTTSLMSAVPYTVKVTNAMSE